MCVECGGGVAGSHEFRMLATAIAIVAIVMPLFFRWYSIGSLLEHVLCMGVYVIWLVYGNSM